MRIKILIYLLFFATALQAQYEREWVRHYGFTNLSEARSVIELNDGTLLVAGYTLRPRSLRADAWLIRLDQNGKKLWDRTYGGRGWDEFVSIKEMEDGNWAAFGWTDSKGHGKTDAWLVKLNPTGDIIWEKTFGTKKWNEAHNFTLTADNGFAILSTFEVKKHNPNTRIHRLDENGNEMWIHDITGNATEIAHSIIELPTGDFLVAGYTSSKGEGKEDGFLVKISDKGETVWEKTFGTVQVDAIHNVISLPNGDIMTVGFSKRPEKDGELWLMKLDSVGNLIQDAYLGGKNFDKGRDIRLLPNNTFVVAGHTNSEGMGKADTWTLVVNNDLTPQWKEVFGGEGYDAARSLCLTSDGGFVIVGKIDFLSLAAFLIVKYHSTISTEN